MNDKMVKGGNIYRMYIGNHSRKKTFAMCQLSQCLQENVCEFNDTVLNLLVINKK